MNNQKTLLQEISDYYVKEVVQPQPHELDEHIPIHNESLDIVGYWNIRCYEELRQLILNYNHCCHPYDCHLPNCNCGKSEAPGHQPIGLSYTRTSPQ